MIWLIALLVIFVSLKIKRKMYAFEVHTLNAFVGTNGSGKTYCAAWLAVRTFKRRYRAVWRANGRIFFHNLFLPRSRKKSYAVYPVLLSNIPLRIPGRGMAYRLEPDHLLCREQMPEGSVVLIDEFGQWLSQYGYNNPNAVNNGSNDEFWRLCRHYGDFTIFLTEQCSENIIFSCRRRVQTLNNMLGVHVHRFLPIWTARVRTISVSEEIKTVEQGMAGESSRLVLGWRPRRRLYDSRCFSARYDTVPPFRGRRYRPDAMKSRRVITCPQTRLPALTDDRDPE